MEVGLTKRKVGMAILVLVLLVVVILGVEAARRQRAAQRQGELPPGSVPIYLDGERVGSFSPGDLESLEQVQFKDEEKGKTQRGWLLEEVLAREVESSRLAGGAQVTVSSSSRGKSITLTWAEISERSNMVMFDLSGRGTLKLVSRLDQLDTRDEWIQDVDKVEVNT